MLIYIHSVLILTNQFFYQFSNDELHAWDIASILNPVEIIKLMPAEGHTFIWYYLLKPFTYFGFDFVYCLKYINWVFMLGAIYLVLRYSPFNTFIKTLIIFSYPFLNLYPVYGRPYGLGIFLLLILTVLFNQRLKRPFLYALLIILTANTSLMAFVGALAFGLIFVFDIFHCQISKKPLFILILGLILLYIQWYNPIIPCYAHFGDYSTGLLHIKDFFTSNCFNVKYETILVFLSIFLVFTIVYLRKSIYSLFFYLFTTISLLLFLTFVYQGYDWHWFFLYIYLVIAFWIRDDQVTTYNISKKVFIALFIAITIIPNIKVKSLYGNPFHTYKVLINNINKVIPPNSKVYSMPYFYIGILSELKNSEYYIVSKYSYKAKSFEAFWHQYDDTTWPIEAYIANIPRGAYLLITLQDNINLAERLKSDFEQQYHGRNMLIYKKK